MTIGITDDRFMLRNFYQSYLAEMTWGQLVPALVLTACFAGILLKKRQRFTVFRLLFYSLYGTFILAATLLGRPAGCAASSAETLFATWEGVFQPDNPAGIYEVLYNILLFLPLGFLFADCGFEKKKAVLFTFLVSLGIETVQLLTGRGIFEICDLVHNTLGGFLGVLLYMAVRKIRTRFRKWRDQSWQTGKTTEK